eukprot:1149571-Pelagomonas_calceolata.AAC.1
MNATLSPQNGTSGNSYEQDKLTRNFIFDTKFCPFDWQLPHRPWTLRSVTEVAHESQPTGGYTYSCIDDIMLPSCILKTNNTNCPFSQLFFHTVDKGYKHSDYIPLVADIPTDLLGVNSEMFQQPAPRHIKMRAF